jgi:hypothetical protein
VRVISVPESVRPLIDWRSLEGRSPDGFVARGSVGESLHSELKIPMLTLIPEGSDDLKTVGVVMSLDVPANIILFSASALDPRQSARHLIEVAPHLPLGSALSRLQS